MPHKATIESLPRAFEMVKAMQADGLELGENYRPLGRQALTEIIEEQMAEAVEAHLEQLEADDAADRRNGYYQRHHLSDPRHYFVGLRGSGPALGQAEPVISGNSDLAGVIPSKNFLFNQSVQQRSENGDCRESMSVFQRCSSS